MKMQFDLNPDYERRLNRMAEEYGEDFELLNGLHKSQLNFSDFVDGFIEKNVADASVDGNANAYHKDARTMLNESAKPCHKLFSFQKIFHDMKKLYGLKTAKEWFKQEWTGGFYMHNSHTASYMPYCFSGDTEIMTNVGIYPLRDLVGERIKVINRYHGWEDAIVQSFGVQPLRKLVIERYGVQKEIFVTGNHRWFVRKGKGDKISECTTDELKSGMRIPFSFVHKCVDEIIPSPFGVAHGFHTGDGDKGGRHRCMFCGDKVNMIDYFSPYPVSGDEHEYVVGGIPAAFDSLPSIHETKPYLFGWLAGFFAADGCVDEKGRCTLASTKKEYLDFARNVMCVLGMPVNQVRSQERVSNLTGELGTVYSLTLSAECLPDQFFLRPFHRDRIAVNEDRPKKNRSWSVVSVDYTGREEEVFCAVTETTGSFTLDGNVLTHNCYAYDLSRLAKEGLFFIKSNYNNEPPKHLTTFLDDLIEYISFMSNRSSGAVGIPNVIIWTTYFWKKDVDDGYYIKNPDYYIRQCFQKFIYRLNQPFIRVDQSAFVNVSIFDEEYYTALFGGVEFPDGSFAVDYMDLFMEHQKIFMEVVSEIRESNIFTFPVLTYALLFKDGDFVDEKFARWCSDHNCKWNDSNFFQSSNTNTLSNCCRLLSDTSKLDGFINSIGGTALSIGSIQVNCINLMRIAYESDCNEKEYLSILRKRTFLCCQALDTVRHIIIRNIQKGLLPNYCEGGVELDKQYCTVGILGLYEVIEMFGYTSRDKFGNVYYTDDGIRFAEKIFGVLNDVKDSFVPSKKSLTGKYSFNIESVPGEKAAVILCQKDNLLFGREEKFIYSNQWIPLSEKCTINEKLRLSSFLDEKCSGGAIAHINLEQNFPNTDVAWEMLKYIAKQNVFYFAFNTRINECENHHGFVGTDVCPKCGKPVFDTYQRIVGFLEPRRTYSKDRKREFDARRWYSAKDWYDYAEKRRDL